MFESPVILPPGRARLLTKPLPTGSPMAPMTMGIVVVAFCAARVAGVPPVTMTSTFRLYQFRRQVGKALVLVPFGKAPLDHQVLAFDVAELAHSPRECTEVCRNRENPRDAAARKPTRQTLPCG